MSADDPARYSVWATVRDAEGDSGLGVIVRADADARSETLLRHWQTDWHQRDPDAADDHLRSVGWRRIGGWEWTPGGHTAGVEPVWDWPDLPGDAR